MPIVERSAGKSTQVVRDDLRRIYKLNDGAVTDRSSERAADVTAAAGPSPVSTSENTKGADATSSAKALAAQAPDTSAPLNRLDLAVWLVSPEHPLTARVTVNRYWAMFFGAGLVKTINDFGSQGEWPSHPELLDWLACQFRDGGRSGGAWDVKALVRLIVISATYRQSAAVTPEKLEKDPYN